MNVLFLLVKIILKNTELKPNLHLFLIAIKTQMKYKTPAINNQIAIAIAIARTQLKYI